MGDDAYQVDMGNNFMPFRRNISYFDANHVNIKPLIESLSFFRNKKSWGYVFRRGFFSIDQELFEIIAKSMLSLDQLSKF